jgi:ATP-binding cassette subfamily B protein
MNLIRKLLPFLKPYWGLALLCLFLLTSVVVMDLAIPRLIQRIIDQGIARGDQSVVLQTALWMLGVSALSTVFAIGNNNFSVRVGESVARDLRDALFLKIQSLSFGNLDRLATGELMVRLTSDASAVQRLVQISLRIGTRAPLLMLGSLLLMINTNAGLAFTLLPLLLVTVGVMGAFGLKLEPMFRSAQKNLDWLNTVLQENIAGARVVKSFVRAQHESRRFEEANRSFTDRTLRVMQYMATLAPGLSVLVNVGMVLVIWAGGLDVIRGELTVGQVVAFINYMLTTMVPLTMMGLLAGVLANGLASLQRIMDVLDMVPEVADAHDARSLPEAARGQVVFENVSFRYGGGRQEAVLEGVDLAAEPGQMVALLGATGAGKSSLVNLIPRFYDVSGGRVLIDGLDVRSLRQDTLLAHLAIVPQDTVLFSGTVRDNIRYGRPDAHEAEVVAAAEAAQAHDFIVNLPNGYDTRVEERGVNLSGGQKQRIAIARALITNPKILILDDSTSAVDVDTETRIQDALEIITPAPARLLEGQSGAGVNGRTSFVVAQRISTVLNADQILVLDKGRVVARGTHSELMQSSPIYREIYDLQLGDGLEAEPALAAAPVGA